MHASVTLCMCVCMRLCMYLCACVCKRLYMCLHASVHMCSAGWEAAFLLKTVRHAWIFTANYKTNVAIMNRRIYAREIQSHRILYRNTRCWHHHIMTVQGIRNDGQLLSPVTPLVCWLHLSFIEMFRNIFNVLLVIIILHEQWARKQKYRKVWRH